MATKKEDINNLKTRYKELADKKYKVSDLAIGTIQMRDGICGKANCKCKKGKPHGPYPYLAWQSKKKERAISVYVSQNELQDMKKRIENYQKLKDDIEDLITLDLKIKKLDRERTKKQEDHKP
jgi:hypothetical protein